MQSISKEMQVHAAVFSTLTLLERLYIYIVVKTSWICQIRQILFVNQTESIKKKQQVLFLVLLLQMKIRF